jgi:hypothetical protein
MASSLTRAASFKKPWSGAKADIRMSDPIHTMYVQAIKNNDEISVKRKTHLERYFKEFCENDDYHRRLSDKKFKREGNFPDGDGNKVTVWTFKGWQWRLYGAILKVDGRRCFVGVEVDPDKKQDRADQAKLKATAKAIAKLEEYHGA